MIQPRSAMKTRERRMVMDLTICWSTTFRNRRAPITILEGTFASDGIYGFALLKYCMGDCHEDGIRPTYSL